MLITLTLEGTVEFCRYPTSDLMMGGDILSFSLVTVNFNVVVVVFVL